MCCVISALLRFVRWGAVVAVLVVAGAGRGWAVDKTPEGPPFSAMLAGYGFIDSPQFQLTVTVTGTVQPPFTYQWQRFGSDVANPRVSNLRSDTLLVPMEAGYEGVYRVVVTNAVGSVVSNTVTHAIATRNPVIIRHPASYESRLGMNLPMDLRVQVNGRAPFTFQWQRNGVDVGAAVTQTSGVHALTLPMEVASAGTYRCYVTNAYGWAVTNPAEITVRTQPGLKRVGPDHVLATVGGAFELKGYVYFPHEGLEWQRNGKKVTRGELTYEAFWPLFTDASLKLENGNVSLADAGSYRLASTRPPNRGVSESVNVVVAQALDPEVLVGAGQVVKLRVKVMGQGLAYEWRRVDGVANGQPLTGARFHGVQTPVLTIDPVTGEDAGEYACFLHWQAYYDEPVAAGYHLVTVRTQPPEVLTNALPNGYFMVPYRQEITVNDAEARVSVAGLPRGLSFDARTREIKGRVAESGAFVVRVTATGVAGSRTQAVPLIVERMTALDVQGRYEVPFEGQTFVDTVGTFSLVVSPSGYFTGSGATFAREGVLTQLKFTGWIGVDETGVKVGYSLPFTVAGRRAKQMLTLSFVGTQELVNCYVGDEGDPAPGYYTTAIYHTWSDPGHPAVDEAGYYTMGMVGTGGYCAMTVTRGGEVLCAGRMPDGTPFTSAHFLTSAGDASLHCWLSKNRGWIQAQISLRATQSIDNHQAKGAGGLGTWRQPAVRDRPDGTVSTVYFEGCRYVAPSAESPFMLNAGALGEIEARLLETDDYHLCQGVLSPAPAHQAVFPASVSGDRMSLGSMVFDPATGVFSGTGKHYEYSVDAVVTKTRSVTFQGIVYRPVFSSRDGEGTGMFSRPWGTDGADSATAPVPAVGIITVAPVRGG